MNQKDSLYFKISPQGVVENLGMTNDPYKMNWVITGDYLDEAGFTSKDKLFGHFDLRVDGVNYNSNYQKTKIIKKDKTTLVCYDFINFSVVSSYSLAKDGRQINWHLSLINQTTQNMIVEDFGVWTSLAYVMFRTHDLSKNVHQSAAIFPSISTNFTKLSAVRRSHTEQNIGIFQTEGNVLSVGTYCEFENKFFEDVSPSLDGLLYHRLILAGGYLEGQNEKDWIYSSEPLILSSQEKRDWEFQICAFADQDDFYKKSYEFGHPIIKNDPLAIVGEDYSAKVILPNNVSLSNCYVESMREGSLKKKCVDFETEGNQAILHAKFDCLGEHKIYLELSNNKEDFFVINVMGPIRELIENRTDYLCEKRYLGEAGVPSHSFLPISKQGESLGKMSLILKANLIGEMNSEQIEKVEKSAVYYVKAKWFKDGDFQHPSPLYGDFYRVMDYEYIGHLFFLLSQVPDENLKIYSSEVYLEWAAKVVELRINPAKHNNQRAKEETSMLGCFFLYIKELLQALKESKKNDIYEKLSNLWMQHLADVDEQSSTYQAAVTEHYYDNAGFGPAAAALSDSEFDKGARTYGELLLANIGYSNDFRAQNPDRWWEALSYMIHSLWGGISASASLHAFHYFKDPRYLLASYRATVGILYCYDSHSNATSELSKGEAASTYSVAGPHLNRPDLSRERFGQSIFHTDGGIFNKLFEKEASSHDWDMGEELVAYLDGFGQNVYCYHTEAGWQVINGRLERKDGELLIRSFAPYPKRAILLLKGNFFELEHLFGSYFLLDEKKATRY